MSLAPIRLALRPFALLCALGSPLAACGGAQTEHSAWTPGPAIPGVNLNGRWYSQEFGDMDLLQDGPKVTGRYEHPRGPEHNGTVRGDIVGDLLKVEWIQPGNSAAAVFPQKGRAVFRIAKDGGSLDGEWGYDDMDHGAGVWKALKSKQ